MLSSNPTTAEFERQIAEHAFRLFSSVYGLTWGDAYSVALYIREYGELNASKALYLISQIGCSFAQARRVIDEADS